MCVGSSVFIDYIIIVIQSDFKSRPNVIQMNCNTQYKKYSRVTENLFRLQTAVRFKPLNYDMHSANSHTFLFNQEILD